MDANFFISLAQTREKDAMERVTTKHVQEAWNSARNHKKTYLLRKLTDHHRLLYELIARSPGVLSGDLWRLYLKKCHTRNLKPIAIRTYSEYCNRLNDIGLIQANRAAIQGKVREFRTIL